MVILVNTKGESLKEFIASAAEPVLCSNNKTDASLYVTSVKLSKLMRCMTSINKQRHLYFYEHPC